MIRYLLVLISSTLINRVNKNKGVAERATALISVVVKLYSSHLTRYRNNIYNFREYKHFYNKHFEYFVINHKL